MKKLTLCFSISILTLTYILAQQTPQSQATIPLTESKNRNIVLKTNLFSPIEFVTQDLMAGMYIVDFQCSDTHWTKKVVVQH